MNIKNGMLVKVVHLPNHWPREFLGQLGIVQGADEEEEIFKIDFGDNIVSWWREENVEVVDDSLAKALDAIFANVIKYNRALHPDSHYSTFEEYCAYRKKEG